MQKWQAFTNSLAFIHTHSLESLNYKSFGFSCSAALAVCDGELYKKVISRPELDPYADDANIPEFFKFIQKEWGVA